MIPVYKHEQNSGLAEQIKSSASIAFTSKVNVPQINDEEKEILNKLVASNDFGANPDQFDLFYLESVLASVGWNENDDVFIAEQMWTARHTPVDKQFNYMHNEKDIIGHITSSKVIDENQEVIAEDTKVEDLPKFFEVVAGAVLYRSWSDQKLAERMNEIIDGIKSGEWFVSMECLFKDFDYALISPNGEQKVVARNEESSFLTKHLRIYGGEGEFEGYKLGRLLKSFAFSGKGLVDNPANKRSLILNSTAKNFNGSKSSIQSLNLETNMPDTEKTVSMTQYEELKSELAQAKEAASKAVEKEIEGYKSTISTLENDKEAVAKELTDAKSLSEEKDEKIKTLEASVAEKDEKISEVESELESIKAEKVKSERFNKLVQVGVEKEKAESIVDKFESASDEMFEEVVALNESIAVTDDKEDKEDKKKDKKKEEKSKSSQDEDIETDDAEAQASDETIDSAEASDDAKLSDGSSAEDAVAETRKAAAAFIGSWLSTAEKTNN